MTDLQDKIFDVLDEWLTGIIEEKVSRDLGCYAKKPDNTATIADRIITLLPKMPKLRWDVAKLKLGNMLVGWVYKAYNPNLYTGTLWDRVVIRDVSEAEARAAVEAAVRKALGWDDAA